MNSKQRKWIVTERGRLEQKGYRFLTAESAADGLIVQVNFEFGRTPIPVGTIARDAHSGEVIADLVEPDARLVLAKGGRGGRGNAFFTTSTRQAPRFAQDGEPGESFTLELSLKLVADVGIVGLPNAGKSTFIRKVSRSQARVAEYPFTTLVPNLGVARVDDRVLVIADIPGLVEGAHEGHGLGDRFLKHVERTRALIHMVSLSPDAPDPLEAYEIIENELAAHSPELAERPRVVVLNKIDLIDDRYELELWEQAFQDRGVSILASSALTGEDVIPVLREVIRVSDQALASDSPEDDSWSPI